MMRCRRCATGVLMLTESLSRRERPYRLLMPIEFYTCVECRWRVAMLNDEAAREWAGRIGIGLLILTSLWVVVGLVVRVLG